MKLKKDKFLLETDILIQHLTMHESEELSGLELALIKGVLFTTVLNAAEVKLLALEADNKECVDGILSGIHILGLHYRYAANVDEFYPKTRSVRDSLFCVTAKINKLPILTDNPERYENLGIKVYTTDDLRNL
jgi:predicted nucleic acid-binding protein